MVIRWHNPATQAQYDQLSTDPCPGNADGRGGHVLRAVTTRRIRDLFSPRTWWICLGCRLHEERER